MIQRASPQVDGPATFCVGGETHTERDTQKIIALKTQKKTTERTLKAVLRLGHVGSRRGDMGGRTYARLRIPPRLVPFQSDDRSVQNPGQRNASRLRNTRLAIKAVFLKLPCRNDFKKMIFIMIMLDRRGGQNNIIKKYCARSSL